MPMPKLYIVSGCNGSGKTTASYTLLPEMLECSEFVNSDEFAKGLSPYGPEKVPLLLYADEDTIPAEEEEGFWNRDHFGYENAVKDGKGSSAGGLFRDGALFLARLTGKGIGKSTVQGEQRRTQYSAGNNPPPLFYGIAVFF